MSKIVKITVATVLLAAAGTIIALTVWPARATGAGRPAEIVDPETGRRYPTTWDKVFAKSGTRPPGTFYSPGANGGWKTLLPDGSGNWGWAVDPGTEKRTPIEKAPPVPTADAGPRAN